MRLITVILFAIAAMVQALGSTSSQVDSVLVDVRKGGNIPKEKRLLLSFHVESHGIHPHLLNHGQKTIAAGGRKVVAESYAVNEI